jgi:SAM-dependent methyltransferase
MIRELFQRPRPPEWPKPRVELRAHEREALEQWYQLWMPNFDRNFGMVHHFNHHFVASLALPAPGSGRVKTLEIGGGSGDHMRFEDLTRQDYYSLELRQEFVEMMNRRLGAERCVLGDIQKGAPWADAFFDRVNAIHVLEHLHDLPAALGEVKRVLRPGGVFDIVLPCEGGALYRVAREFSSKRLFEKNFKIPYDRIIKSDHVNTYADVEYEVERAFAPGVKRFFPIPVPSVHANICVGLRLVRR